MSHCLRYLVLSVGLLCALPAFAKNELKIATLAPDGSSWMRVLKKMKSQIAKQTGGAVDIRFYPGQVQGDERDVVRKMNVGQLEGGIFTAIGLSMINPEVLVLQMPMVFENYDQLDKVRSALSADFEKSFRKKGFELLGWADLGWIYIFSKSEVKNMAALRKQRVWVWNDDVISKALFRKFDVPARPMALPQVYPALNTGMIDTVYNPPLGCLSLQWHTKMKYYQDFPLAIGIGATVVTKKSFDALSKKDQKIVKQLAGEYHEILVKRIRKDNDKALQALKSQGLSPVAVDASVKKDFKSAALSTAESFAPRYYSKELLNKVMQLR
jgi:TRAP-type C4-dicarboxylate transport system substrate-binding protein